MLHYQENLICLEGAELVFDVEIKFKVGGREVSPGKFGDAVTAAALKEVAGTVKAKLQRIRCPEHNQSPRVEVSGPSLDRLEWTVHACCQKLIDEATKVLR